MTLQTTLIPALSDNYIYLIHGNGQAIVVDPADPKPVRKALEEKQLQLTHILNTHHHLDHIAGNEALKAETGCELYAPNDERISSIDKVLEPGSTVQVGPLEFQVIAVPGHTSTHIALYAPEPGWLFCGDSLFCGGCGRLFEGTPAQMWDSLKKLMALPDDTLVYCGHEYTQSNLEFALTVDGDNPDLQKRLEFVKELRADGKASIPSTIGEEKASNPFLRINDPEIRTKLDMNDASESEVFAKIRQMKDSF